MASTLPRLILLGAMLLELYLPQLSALQGAPEVPVRVLQTELTEMDQGTPAFIHTSYATGIGYLLPSGQEVVTARHNVLKPSGDLEMHIGVGVPRPPLDNIEEGTGTPVAQDPSRDLVVLRLAHAMPTPSPANLSAKAVPPLCPSISTGPMPLASTHGVPAHAESRRTAVRAMQLRRQRNARRLELVMHGRPSTVKNGPALRVVWDGPIVKHGAEPVTTAMVRRPGLRIVRDGPLH